MARKFQIDTAAQIGGKLEALAGLDVLGDVTVSAKVNITGGTMGPLVLGGQATATTHAVRADRAINTGVGLAGGGDLTADRTLSISFGGNGSANTVARSDHNHDAVYTQKTTSTASMPTVAGWYRLATSLSSIQRVAGQFVIDWTTMMAGGRHGQLILNVGTMYGMKPVLNQLSYITHSSSPHGITKARIVYHPTYNGNFAYLEVYLANPMASGGTGSINVQFSSNASNTAWTLVSPDTPGAIPVDYLSEEISLTQGFVTSGQFKSELATGTAPLAVISTTKVDNLNADTVDGYHGNVSAVFNTVAVRDANGDLTTRRYLSTVAEGTAPFSVQSTTKVDKLNSDMVDGYHASFEVLGDTLAVRGTNGSLYAYQMVSTAPKASGFAPLGVGDNDIVVANLNADMVDGKHASDFSLATHNHDAVYAPKASPVFTGTTTVVALDATSDIKTSAGYLIAGTLYISSLTRKLSLDSGTTWHSIVTTKGMGMITFPPGYTSITITHNLGTTGYVVTLGADSAARHVFWRNKTENTIQICIDSAFTQNITVDYCCTPL